jgi:hypothetical protein
MSKKTILFTVALMSATPAFASQGNPACLPAHSSNYAKHGTAASAASVTKSLRQAEPARLTADEYAPSARSVYFGH